MVDTIRALFFSFAMDYVLRLPVDSPENLPPFPASIKDGYAIKFDGVWSTVGNIFEVVQVSVAGTAVSTQLIKCELFILQIYCIKIDILFTLHIMLQPNYLGNIGVRECVRISTGAPLPPGANCVIQVEDTSVVSMSSDGTIEKTIDVLKMPSKFDNIR